MESSKQPQSNQKTTAIQRWDNQNEAENVEDIDYPTEKQQRSNHYPTKTDDWASKILLTVQYFVSHDRNPKKIEQTALSAAPTPTQISLILGIVLVAFRWSFVSYPFGLPCAVSKA